MTDSPPIRPDSGASRPGPASRPRSTARIRFHLFSFVLGCSRWLWGRAPTRSSRRCRDATWRPSMRAEGRRKKRSATGCRRPGRGRRPDRGLNPPWSPCSTTTDRRPRPAEPTGRRPRARSSAVRYIRQDFFLDRTRCLDDLNAQCANPRVHTTGRIVDQAFAEEQSYLVPLPAHHDAVREARRPRRNGLRRLFRARRRTQARAGGAAASRIFEDRTLIARHPVLEGRNRRRVDPGHRRPPPPCTDLPKLEEAPKRSLAFYDAVGRRLERQGAAR